MGGLGEAAHPGQAAHLAARRRWRQVVDVRRLGAAERRMAVDALIADIHRDNLRLLRKQRQRMDRVGVRPPTVEVRWRDLCVEAECQVVQGKPLPTIWNAAISTISVRLSSSLIHPSLQSAITANQ
ncbi:hypothetical protein HU200_013297 [Digitaria exilis]|uniref:Pleiotropic ABC efflux transporter N-terminal domain-containing protein n=1 Tax=Digitaria exilis TaxID=1010633 RepID=A0A835FDL8_9POAL|nr:hypothetical protein HU200_013297 [Digitaria exilis]